MTSLYERIVDAIGREAATAQGEDSRDDLGPELLPTVAQKAEMERHEADELLASWRASGGVPPALDGGTVVEGCGALRAYIERLLRDAEQNHGASARLERQPGYQPYLEIRTRRTSRLGRTAPWSSEDIVTVRVLADAFAAQVSRRVGVDAEAGAWLWTKVFDAMQADHAFQFLFEGLDLQVLPEGVVCVRL